MSISAKLQKFLDEHQVKYHVLRHHETYTAPEIAAALHVPGKELAKVVIVKADHEFLMAVLPANFRVNLRELAQATGADKVELATEGEFQNLFPDCEVGAMPPFGNLYDLPVYVDVSLTEDKEIVFEAGSHREAIKMTYADFERLVHPKVIRFAQAA
jgi:Ala-tRNA(Pro) deacylase